MKTYEELMADKRLQITNRTMDGGAGYIVLNGRQGTVCFSYGGGWEHVSVALFGGKTPSWNDMCALKDMFWNNEECVVQFHPPKSEYVNNVENCLHLWKPIGQEFPIPDSILVGIKGVTF